MTKSHAGRTKENKQTKWTHSRKKNIWNDLDSIWTIKMCEIIKDWSGNNISRIVDVVVVGGGGE